MIAVDALSQFRAMFNGPSRVPRPNDLETDVGRWKLRLASIVTATSTTYGVPVWVAFSLFPGVIGTGLHVGC